MSRRKPDSSRWQWKCPAERFVAEAALNPSGAIVASTDRRLAEPLSTNPRTHLSEDVWLNLWAQRSNLNLAQHCVMRRLSRDQLDTVIADDGRVSVLVCALEANPPSAEQALSVLAKRVGRKVAREVRGAETWPLPAEVYSQWCTAAGGEVGLRWLIDHPEVDPTPYVASPAWLGHPTKALRVLIAQLLMSRPEAIEALCAPDTHPTLVGEAAASHLLGGRDDLAWQIVLRDPNRDLALTNGAPALWGAWLSLMDNPFVSQCLVDELVARIDERRSAGAWRLLLATPLNYNGKWEAAENVYRRAACHGARIRAAVGFDPAKGLSSITDRAAWETLVGTLSLRDRSTPEPYCTLAVAADAVLRFAPSVQLVRWDSTRPWITEFLASKMTVKVLGVARAREMIRQLGLRRRIAPREASGGRGARREPRTQMVRADEPFPLSSLPQVDDAGAAVLGNLLQEESQWAVLFRLLADAEYNEDLFDLVAVAKALG